MQPRVYWGLAFGILPFVLSFGLLANVGLNLTIGLSCALPAYLYWRESQKQQHQQPLAA